MSWDHHNIHRLTQVLEDIARGDDFKKTNGIMYNVASLFDGNPNWMEEPVVITVKNGKMYVVKYKDITASSGWLVLKNQVILNPDNILSVEPKKEGFIMGGCNMSQLKA